MPVHKSEIFIYDNIYFENGKRDKDKHPVIIAGEDENFVYCFAMTSQLKHLRKNSQIRNEYNSKVKYAETFPGQNCTTNNAMRGLVNTTNCIVISKEEAKKYPRFGIAHARLLEELAVKWAYQQNEILDKKSFNYNQICTALGISDSVKIHPIYRQCDKLMQDNPAELQTQRQYAAALRKYREESTKIRRQNINNRYRNIPPLPFPKEPLLPDDKSFYEQYASPQLTEEEIVQNSPFAGLSEKLFGKEETKEELATKPASNIISFPSEKQQLLEMRKMLLETQEQGQSQEYQSQHGRRAA